LLLSALCSLLSSSGVREAYTAVVLPCISYQISFVMDDSLLDTLEEELRAAVTGLVAMARTRIDGAFVEVAEVRAKGLVEVAEERAKALAEVDARRADLGREVEAMHQHKEAQEGRVELNIGGYRFQTSVQALRRVPHTFFDAYFSGRYAQDVCDDGSIFVDRDGEHFGHVLEYMRDGHVSVAESGADPSVSLLRALKREFGFYCIELVAEQPAEPERPEVAYVVGGVDDSETVSSMERYDASSCQWSTVAAMGTARARFGTCAIFGELFVTGGQDDEDPLSSVEVYSPSSNTWSVGTPLPENRADHAAVAVGSTMYVLGGKTGAHEDKTASVLLFDSEQNVYTEVAPMPEARSDFAACAIGNDIYVFGGRSDGGRRRQASVFKYDTMANAWSTLAPMPRASGDHSVSVLNGLIYIVGAYDGHHVFQFDPASGVWRTLAPTLSDSEGCSTFVLGGCLYAAGGAAGGVDVEIYDTATNTWAAMANMLVGRFYSGAVTIGSSGPAEELDLFDSLLAKACSRRH
jgi:hypothetical protein